MQLNLCKRKGGNSTCRVRRENYTVGKESKQQKFDTCNARFSDLVAYITKCELKQKRLT